MVCAALLMASSGAVVQVERGRDPWVFRAVFEDRPRSLIVAAGHNVWFAFNTHTCAWHKVWNGDIKLLGKVYDFSQDNSQAEGNVLAKSYEELFEVGRELGSGWRSEGAKFEKDGWVLSGDGAYVESPPVDLRGYETLYTAFDERSKKGRLKIEVRKGEEVKEWFGSSTDVSSDTNWMWNFKYLLNRDEGVRIRYSQDKGEHRKGVRNMRLFGDRPGWAVMTRSGLKGVEPVFKGYEVDGVKSVKLFFDLVVDGEKIGVQVRPETMAFGNDRRWSAAYVVTKPVAGLTPVMLGWNEHLDKEGLDGDVVSWKGIEGMMIRSRSFLVGGEVK